MQCNKEPGELYRLLLIGDTGVGKSSLFFRFIDDTFSPQRSEAFGLEVKTKTLELDDSTTVIQVWDTVGRERYRTVSDSYFSSADGVFLIYDVTNETSFNNISTWLEYVNGHNNERLLIFLIGNKADRITERVIQYHKAKEYAIKMGLSFLETSAKDNVNIEQAFVAMTAKIKHRSQC